MASASNIAASENLAVHFLGGAVVLVALLIHPAEQWIAGRL